MANEDNLIPASERSKSEARELGKKGGQASGKARQKKKRLQEAVEAVLSRKYDVDGEEVTGYVAAALGVLNKAMTQGDASAFNALRDITGEKPVDKVDMEVKGNEAQEELREYLQELKKK